MGTSTRRWRNGGSVILRASSRLWWLVVENSDLVLGRKRRRADRSGSVHREWKPWRHDSCDGKGRCEPGKQWKHQYQRKLRYSEIRRNADDGLPAIGG